MKPQPQEGSCRKNKLPRSCGSCYRDILYHTFFQHGQFPGRHRESKPLPVYNEKNQVRGWIQYEFEIENVDKIIPNCSIT